MNFRSLLIVIILETLSVMGFAQAYQDMPEYKHFICPSFPSGCYMSFKDFQMEKPIVTMGFQMDKRISSEIKDSRSGGYWLHFDKKLPSKLKSEDHVWGVYYDDTLYLNRRFFQGKSGFVKVYCLGSCGYFHGINPHSGNISDDNMFNTVLLFGVVGGLIAEGVDKGRNDLYGKYPKVMIYLVDYKSGMVSPLSRFKLEQILENDQELLDLYSKEKFKSSMMVMHAYLDTFAEKHKYK